MLTIPKCLIIFLIIMHGAVWIQLRTLDSIESRARQVAKYSAITLFLLFAVAGLSLYLTIEGFTIIQMPDANSGFVPQMKQVSQQAGAWLLNYQQQPWFSVAPLLTFLSCIMVYFTSHHDRAGWAFIASAGAIAGVILTAGFSMFPFVMPSSTIASHSLTLWDASSSLLTLKIMFWVAAIIVPIIMAYSFWTYRKMWRRLDTHFIINNQHTTY